MEKQEKMLKALLGKIHKLLDTGRVTDERGRHCLEFMMMEASALVESRRLPPPPPPWTYCDHCSIEVWLDRLTWTATKIDECLDKHDDGKVGHALLQKAARPFRRRKPSHLLRQFDCDAYELYQAAEECCGYELPSSDLRPQAAKECDLVGIDRPAKKLLRWLTAAAADDDDTSLRVMCIVGPTGVGMTTLAMELHRRLQCQTAQHFQCCAAASFSRSSDRCNLLLQSILLQLQIVDLETCSLRRLKTRRPGGQLQIDDPKQLARSISERLHDKRYLILIDGICNESDWEIIKGAFPNNNCGSQLLITTRDELMIRMCFSDYDVAVRNMEPLNDSDSENCPPDNLKPFYDEILTKRQGIPLLIIRMTDWLKHESSAVSNNTIVNRQILLSFGYDGELRLPSLYLSMFPQGRVFDKHSVLMRETVVNWFEIFSKLVDKNIIIPVAENSSLSLNVEDDESCQWQVNPSMLQFFASKAAETGFAFTSTTLASARGSGKMTRRARRLALHHPDPQLPGMLQEIDLFHTRSLLISGAVDRISISLDKFAYLVVLDLQGWENLKDEDMLQICRMFMMRYLSIRNTRISKLPPQIRELRNLKTLDVSHTHISELPSEVSELTCLMVLDLRGTHISQLPENLRHLSTLLVGGNGVINSDETVEVTPMRSNVNTLATVDLSECSANFVERHQEFIILGSLAITCSFHQCTEDILLSTIQKLSKLESLTIHCGFGCSMEFLGSLSDPPKKLNKLKVTCGRFVSVPRWIGGLEKLVFLQITICRLVPNDVKILANLKKLERLVLGLEIIPEEEIVIECEGFKELQRFCLDCPVPWLTFKQGAMPILQRLQLKICSGPVNQENAVPSGLNNLRNITEVVICYSKWCSNSSSIKKTVEAVRKQVAMHLKGIDLVINGMQENEETAGSASKNECGSEDVEAFGEEAESVAECGTKDDFDAADDEAERRATDIQSEIEDIECETEIHA
ncbi:hypothetical protein ABZP36_009467 [Zizania latifolia]